ncbi:MAG: hypothetical protein ACSLE8_08040 [Rhodococcus sp. (in: high G+C Gram-positive bacteria)]
MTGSRSPSSRHNCAVVRNSRDEASVRMPSRRRSVLLPVGRTTMRYDRARRSLDRHATYIESTFIAGATPTGLNITHHTSER